MVKRQHLEIPASESIHDFFFTIVGYFIIFWDEKTLFV